MSDVEKLAAMRISREQRNVEVRPIDLLRAAAHDVETGAAPCDGVLVLLVRRDGAEWTINSLRAGLPWTDELVLLALEQQRAIHRQLGAEP